MFRLRGWAYWAGTLAVACGLADPASAQQATATWQATTPGDWSVAEHWLLNGAPGVPSGERGDHAQVGAGGVAIVSTVASAANATVASGGALRVEPTATLNLATPPGGGEGGMLSVEGGVLFDGGRVATEFDAINDGVMKFQAGGSLQVGRDYSGSGRVEVRLDALAAPPIQVDGTATLSGELTPLLDDWSGVAFGDSWNVLTASTIEGAFALDPSVDAGLAEGLRFRSRSASGVATLDVNNRLIITIDRNDGKMTAVNRAGAPIVVRSYEMRSDNGLLAPGGWVSFDDIGAAGFQETDSSEHLLAESTAAAVAFTLDRVHSFGLTYQAGPQPTADEDVSFEYLTGEGELVAAEVRYVGPLNEVVLRIDRATGEGTLLTDSKFFTTEITGYTIQSDAGSLAFDDWISLSDSGLTGWQKTAGDAHGLAESNGEGSTLIAKGEAYELGAFFSLGGEEDLILEYMNLAGETIPGVVEFVGEYVPPLAGDVNGDGVVDLVDFNLLKANFGATGPNVVRGDGDLNGDSSVDLVDFNLLKSSFGATSSAVPEPAAWIGLCGGLALCLLCGRSRSGA